MGGEQDATARGAPHYRFGFVLSTALGNQTRYLNLRKYADRDPQVEATWAPVRHFIAPGEHDPFKGWPRALRSRAIVLRQAAPVLRSPGRFDAVMMHLFEAEILTALRGYWAKTPLRVISSDAAPALDPRTYPMHPVDLAKPAWRRAIRLKIDTWRFGGADLLIPFSRWAADLTIQATGMPPARVKPLHVGVDLELWRHEPRPATADDARVKVLFCGGDFLRKGGQDLLAAFNRHLSRRIELHLVTRSAPAGLPPHVRVYDNLDANDPQLMRLYREADMLVHPTASDLSSWVVLEAMASGLPAVTTRVGGIPELVDEGRTGIFVPVGDVDALAAAILRLADNPQLRRAMGYQARLRAEEHFNAAVNVPRILGFMKELVDLRASGGRLGNRLQHVPGT